MKILILTKELPYPANTIRKIRTYNYIKDLTQENNVTVLSRFDRSYDNTDAVNHFTEMGARPVFCNEAIQTLKGLNLCKNIFLSLFSPFPYSVTANISERMLERFLHIYVSGKFDKIICDGIHQTIHVPKEVYCYKVLLEHEISSPRAKDVRKKNPNPIKKLFALIEWKKFHDLENQMWHSYDEIHVYYEDSKKRIEERVKHKNVHVVFCE